MAIKQESEDTDRERLKNGQYLDFGERATRQQFGTKDKDILGSSMKVSKLGLINIILSHQGNLGKVIGLRWRVDMNWLKRVVVE